MSNRSIEIVSERGLSRIFAEHFAGAVLSVLPERWRRWWSSEPSDAVVSGAIEAGVASYIFLRVMIAAIEGEVQEIDPRIMTGAAMTHGDAAVTSLGPMIILGLLLKPATLALAVTALDGYVRAATAMISEEVLPSVWLGGVPWVVGRLKDGRTERIRAKTQVERL
jgi:ABC-type transport system involved in cytochrome c biogenesis permease subunit